MEYHRECIVCNTPFRPESNFCISCGAVLDEEVLDEARSINYMIGEIKDWPRWLTIRQETQNKLINHYQDRLALLGDSLRPAKVETVVLEEPAPPPILFVQSQPQPEEPPPTVSPIETLIAAPVIEGAPRPSIVAAVGSTPEPPPPATPTLVESMIEQSQFVAEEIVEPVVERRSISELVAENIKLIFAISAALFVGGVLLYYRNEIYFGLKQPRTQAIILALVTLSSVIGGWTLVRKTHQTLAGRTLTLVGSLLVPINPWFLVRTRLIPESGNGWILGLACAALYAWTAYFLRERLYVYLALATGIITGWAAVYRYTDGSQTCGYSVVLMAFSLAYLLAERAFKPSTETDESVAIDFASPFFHVAQIGMALSLLFYTPLVAFVPGEFLAAKRYFDPQGYSGLNTIWLSLCAAFGYFYSGLIRRSRVFVYLGILASICAEAAILHNLDVTWPTKIVTYTFTALVVSIVSRYAVRDDFYATPLAQASIVASLSMLCAAVTLVVMLLAGSAVIPGWRILFSLVFGAGILVIEAVRRKLHPAICVAAFLLSVAGLLTLIKITVPVHLIAILFLAPIYALLYAGKNLQDPNNDSIYDYFQPMALVLLGCVVAGSIINQEVWIAHKVFLSLLSLGIAGAFMISARNTEDRDGRIVQLVVSILFGALSYGSALKSTRFELGTLLPLGMLFPMALLGTAVWKSGSLGGNAPNTGIKLSNETMVFRTMAITLAVAIILFCLAFGPYPNGGLRFALLMGQFAAFFIISGFNSKDYVAGSVQLYLSILSGSISYGALLRSLTLADHELALLLMAIPYALVGMASAISKAKNSAAGSENELDVNEGKSITKTECLREAFVNSSVLSTLLAVVLYAYAKPTFGHHLSSVVLMAEFAGLFGIFGHIGRNRITSYASFLTTAVFSTLSLLSFLAYLHIEDYLFPFQVIAGWALSLYLISQFAKRLRVEFRDALSLFSTFLTICIASLSVVYFLFGWHVESEYMPLLLVLMIICAKEVLHTIESRSTVHSTLAGVIGLLLLGPVFLYAGVEMRTALLWLQAMSILYLIAAHRMRIKQIEDDVFIPIETISNLVMGASLFLTLASAIPFGLRSCVSTAVVAGFCGFAAVTRTDKSVGKVYAHATAALLLATSAMLLDHFGLRNWFELSVVLLPLLSVFLLLEHSVKGSIFERSFSNVAQVALPIVAILGLRNTLIVPYTLAQCVSAAAIAVFYGLAAAARRDQLIGKIYAHFTSAFVLITSAMLMNHFGLAHWSELACVLLPLLSVFLLLEYRIKASVFERSFFNVAQAALPIIAVLGFSNEFANPFGLKPCVNAGAIAVFCALAAVARSNTVVDKIYAHASSIFLLVTSALLLNHFGLTSWSELSSILIPLLSVFLLLEYAVKRSVFEQSFSNVAQFAVPIVAILGFSTEFRAYPLGLRPCVSAAAITVFCGLAALTIKKEFAGRIYAHATAVFALVTSAMLMNHFGLANWSELSTALIPLLSVFLLLEYTTKNSIFNRSLFDIPQIALPILVVLGLLGELTAQVTPMQTSLFFAEISVFYLLSAIQKRLAAFVYPALATFAIAFWYLLNGFGINTSLAISIFALLGFAFFMLFKTLKQRQHWAAEAMNHGAHLTLILAGLSALVESIPYMHLNDRRLSQVIVSFIAITAVGAAVSLIERNKNISLLYRTAAIVMSIVTYLTVGRRLGYDLMQQTEFYSLPLGAIFLVTGYVLARRRTGFAAFWLWAGSLLLSVPVLLHALQYRFINNESSSRYDVTVLIVSVVLILGGILAQLKAPTIAGGTSFLTSMSVIVFSFVDWEQKTLSLAMIVLALVIFTSSWIIYWFYKRNQLGNLGRQGKQVLQEFGKWK